MSERALTVLHDMMHSVDQDFKSETNLFVLPTITAFNC